MVMHNRDSNRALELLSGDAAKGLLQTEQALIINLPSDRVNGTLLYIDTRVQFGNDKSFI
jgi:hypothetical protein